MGWKFCLVLSILASLFLLPAAMALGQEIAFTPSSYNPPQISQPSETQTTDYSQPSQIQTSDYSPPSQIQPGDYILEEKMLLEQDSLIREKGPECENALCSVGVAVKHAISKVLTFIGLSGAPRGKGDGICQDRDNGDVGICSLSENCYGFYLEDRQDIYHQKTSLDRSEFGLLDRCSHVDKFGNNFENVPCEQRIEFFENGNSFIGSDNEFKLQLSNSVPAYRYTINFSNESSPASGEFKHSILNIFGEEWRVIHSEGQSVKKIILMNSEKSQNVLIGGESAVYYEGKRYPLTLSLNKKSLVVSIDGNTFPIAVGDVIQLADNVTVGVEEITNEGATFSFGARKIVLEDGKPVQEWGKSVGRDRAIAGSMVTLETYDQKKENRIKRISISYISPSIIQIKLNEYWTDPVFGKFKFALNGIIPRENCSNCPEDCGKCAEPPSDQTNETLPEENGTNATLPGNNETSPYENYTADYTENVTLPAPENLTDINQTTEFNGTTDEGFIGSENFTNNLTDNPADSLPDDSGDNLINNPADNLTDDLTDNPADSLTDNLTYDPIDNPTDNLTENLIDNLTDNLPDNLIENPADNLTDSPSDSVPDYPKPDVAAYLELMQPMTVGVGSNITANVENIGEGDASNVAVKIYELSGSDHVELARGDIGFLSTNQMAEVSIFFIANESREYYFRVSADVADDENLSNNLYDSSIMAVSESSIENNSSLPDETSSENVTAPTNSTYSYGNESQGVINLTNEFLIVPSSGNGGSGGGGGSSKSRNTANDSLAVTGKTSDSNQQPLPAPSRTCGKTEIFGYCTDRLSFQWMNDIKLFSFLNLWWVLIIIFLLVVISLVDSYLEMIRCNRIADCKKKEIFSAIRKQGDIKTRFN